MGRFALFFIIGGGVLGWLGIQEFRVSHDASAEPVALELTSLERGQPPASNYVIVGKHIALYPAAVVSYPTSKYSKTEPTETTSVNYCYYPILSAGHTWFKDVMALELKHDGKIPDNIPDPELRDVAVLVKTKRFPTFGSIPQAPATEQSVKGLFINRIAGLSSEEEKFVRQSIPNVDSSKILLLEEGRSPASLLMSFGMMGGGAVLILIGVAGFFGGAKKT